VLAHARLTFWQAGLATPQARPQLFNRAGSHPSGSRFSVPRGVQGSLAQTSHHPDPRVRHSLGLSGKRRGPLFRALGTSMRLRSGTFVCPIKQTIRSTVRGIARGVLRFLRICEVPAPLTAAPCQCGRDPLPPSCPA